MAGRRRQFVLIGVREVVVKIGCCETMANVATWIVLLRGH
jgi:hypothetical protein